MRNPEIKQELKDAFGRQMDRLKALTQQLLSFSKPKPPELKPIDVNTQVADSLKLVITELRHDSVEIEQVLTDLANVSGYGELSSAPLCFIGHSAGGPQAKSLAIEMASR